MQAWVLCGAVMDIQQFQTVLLHTFSRSQAERAEAERQLDSLKVRLPAAFGALGSILRVQHSWAWAKDRRLPHA